MIVGALITQHYMQHIKNLKKAINEKGLEKPIVIIADGHK